MNKHAALVLEGGGFRAMFATGVLDVFMERGLQGFSGVWGVSAGALNATSYLSGQCGRVCRINLAFRDDRRYMSAYQLATTGNIVSPTFLYDDVQNEIDPFDYEAFAANPTRFYAVLSDVMFGRPEYVQISDLPAQVDYIRASASLPVLSQMVKLDGRLYLDGGTCDSVPLERALQDDDIERALVVLTRHRAYRKKPSALLPAERKLYADYPYYLEALQTRPERYDAQREYIWQQEKAGTALIIAPDKPLGVGNMEHSGSKLLDIYLQGRHVTEGMWERIVDFLDL